MRAVQFTEHGGPEVLQLAETAVPEPGPGEIRVRVRACALNHLDLWVRKGLPGVQIPMPHTPGCDIAGEVESVGAGVRRVREGDAVVLNPGVSCGHCDTCLAGHDSYCRHYTLLGYLLPGGDAEYVVAPARGAFPKPAGLEWEQAAAVPLVFLTAWHMLAGRARLQPGESVLVWGAGSGVGSAAIQIAKVLGARVLATAGSDEKLERARDLGADEAVNHSSGDVAEAVKTFAGRSGVDVVFEHVGQATWERSLRCLRRGGRLVTCGATTGAAGDLDLRRLFANQWSILGSYMGGSAELSEVLRLVGQGRLRPVIDRVLPLAEVAEAHRALENREQFGKIVLRV